MPTLVCPAGVWSSAVVRFAPGAPSPPPRMGPPQGPRGGNNHREPGGIRRPLRPCHETGNRKLYRLSPSFVREIREPNLVAVWKNALDFLRGSDHWIIIGYSFPDEDVGIRALFTRAFGAIVMRPRPLAVRQVQTAPRRLGPHCHKKRVDTEIPSTTKLLSRSSLEFIFHDPLLA